MKKLIALLLVFCVIAFGSCGADSDGPSTLPDGENSPMVSYSESIVFITTGEGGSFWDNVKKGTQEASKKYGVNVIFKGLGRESLFSEEAQSALLKEASQSGADAVIISSVGSGLTEAIEAAFEKGVPVVEFENGLSATDKNSLSDGGKSIISSRIFSDEKEAGMLCADSVFEKRPQ